MLGELTMDNGIIIIICIAALGLVIGNFSLVQKNAKTPLRKKSLNDLQETLQAILDQNISVVSANYTLLTTPGNQGKWKAGCRGLFLLHSYVQIPLIG